MEYSIRKKIKINRPIIFLCGPYPGNEETDRRSIMQNYLDEKFHRNVIPLIIDKFLIAENIKDDSISLQLMEEICADVAAETYIFLDTMSAATELGIFANNVCNNIIKVFIPDDKDVINPNSVGYFVKNAVLEEHPDSVQLLYYRPKIDKMPIATNYCAEYYSFVKNTVPVNIQKSIEEDRELIEKSTFNLNLNNSDDYPKESFEVCYQLGNNSLNVKVSLKFLFYVTTAIVQNQYSDIDKVNREELGQIDVAVIEKQVQNAIANLIFLNTDINKQNIEEIIINTTTNKSFSTLINHIIKFVTVYYGYSQYKGRKLLSNPINNVIEEYEQIIHPNVIFELSDKDVELIVNICKDKELFFKESVLLGEKKKRKIVTYTNDKYGLQARYLHEKLNNIIKCAYSSSSSSFAYKNKYNIKMCVEKHLHSNSFVKYDIEKFFESIDINLLKKKIGNSLRIEKKYNEKLNNIIDTVVYKDKLPLGFITSPILSDLYLNEFDSILGAYAEEHDYIYTRYADDILFSAEEVITENAYKDITFFISSELKKLKLKINTKKSSHITFDEHHSHIKYLGVNIISSPDENYISVGKKYIYDIAKDVLNYAKIIRYNLNVPEQFLFYERHRLIGKIDFVKQIEGDRGMNLLRTRLKKYDNLLKDVNIENL